MVGWCLITTMFGFQVVFSSVQVVFVCLSSGTLWTTVRLALHLDDRDNDE